MIKKFNSEKTKYLKMVNYGLNLFFHTKKSKEKIDWKNVKKILIIDFTGMGDLVMLLPFLNVVKKNAPKAIIGLACRSYGKELLEEQEVVDHFYIYTKEQKEKKQVTLTKKIRILKELIRQINCETCDIALEPKGDLRCIFFMYYCNARRKISYNYTGGEGLLTDVVKPSDDVCHLIDEKLYFLKILGCSYCKEDQMPRLYLTNNQKMQVKEIIENYDLKNKIVVGIHPGASLEIKQWRGYEKLLEKIIESYKDLFFLIFEGPGENYVVDKVMETVKRNNVPVIRSRTNIKQYMQYISLCDVMICNDSSAGHIAAAYGIKTFVIFGPVQPERAVPYGKKVYAISNNELECIPCVSSICMRNNECIISVTVDMVFKEIRKYWNE